jgi:hypothetical protein
LAAVTIERKDDRMRIGFGLAALAATAALLAAGCGGGGGALSKEEYEDKVVEVGEQLSTTLEGLGSATSPDELASTLDSAQEAFGDAASDLGDVTPPSEVADAHAQLVAGLSAMVDDLEGLGSALGDVAENPAAAAEVLTQLGELGSFADLTAAIAQLEAAGYDVG